jgi:HAMP domain-containing protein
MTLRLKFNLVLGLASLAGIVLAAVLIYNLLQQNAREEVMDSARIMMQSALAVRGYTSSEIQPLLVLQQKRQFLPQTVPAYAAHRYIGQLQTEYPDYSYREATLNPTNPADRAVDWEADIVNHFRNNPARKELIGTRETPTGPSLYLSRPIQITDPSCLLCHSQPSAAPATMLDMYGSSNGFGWKLDEVIGAQIVSVPMSLPLDRADRTFKVFLSLLVGVFLVIALLLNILLDYIVIRPITKLAHYANTVSLGDLEAEELPVKGSDEVSVLTQSFNRMHRSLANAVRMLDDTAAP